MLAWKRMHLPAALTLALLVPALLVGAWAWLWFDGSLARLRADERREADAALGAAEQRLTEELGRIAQEPGRRGSLTVTLDEEGLPLLPFPVGDGEGLEQMLEPVPSWLEVALRHEAAGQTDEALAFLRAGGETGALPFAAVLATARCLAASEKPAEARAWLAAHRPAARRASMEPLLLALLDARLAADAGDRAPAAALYEAVLTGREPVPAAAAGCVVGWLAGWSDAAPGPRERQWRLAAGLVGQLARKERRVPDRPELAGELVVVPAPGCVRLLGPEAVDALVDEALAHGAATGPWRLVAGRAPGDEPWAELPATGRACHAEPRATLPSRRQEGMAQLFLLAAAISFVAGNLLVLALGRRELQVSRLRGSFVDLVSHELRTPLTALSLRAEMLARDAVPADKTGAYHTALYRDVRRLADLVARILDFARLEKGRTPCSVQPLLARQLLARVVRAERPHLRGARQRLRVTAARSLPALHADPEVLGRALRNLIENATKYAPPGSEVTLSASADNGTFRLAVADQGPGIPAAERRRVFEPFHRGNGAVGKPGSGLGLAIVAEAARAHGGRVRVDDRPGGGAVFVLELPAHGQGGA